MNRNILLVFSFFSAVLVSAQNIQLKFDVNVFNPTGDFANVLGKKVPGGASIGLLVQPKKLPFLEVGGSFGLSMYEYREYNVMHTPKNGTPVEIKVYEDDCFISYGLEGKIISPKSNLFKPYLSLNTGGNTFYSHIDPDLEEYDYRKFKWQGTSWTVGTGLGLRLDIGHMLGDEEGRISLDIARNINVGTKANYRFYNKNEAPKENLNFGINRTAVNYNSWKFSIMINLYD